MLFDEKCHPLKLGEETISCLMYADDLVILSESAMGMQNCLDELKKYTSEWGLEINREKTKILIFQKGGQRPKHLFRFGELNIDIIDRYKYLGTTVTHWNLQNKPEFSKKERPSCSIHHNQ